MPRPLRLVPSDSSPASAALVQLAPRKHQIREAREAQILAAAEQVFARSGLVGATMAEIAEIAGVPKPNVHYYFGSKEGLYRAVLEHTLKDWLVPAERLSEHDHPREALSAYIRQKVQLTFDRPDASRVFANEILHGAPVLRPLLETDLRALVQAKAQVVQSWIDRGLMAEVDPVHLFFTIWASTQTYADFEAQIGAVLGAEAVGPQARDRALRHVESFVLRGCGL